MKKISLYMMFLFLVFSQACEGPAGTPGADGLPGPAGPVGPPGPAGPAGAGSVATSFIYQADFAAPNYVDGFAYEELENFPLDVSLDDAVLVYRLSVLGEQPNFIFAWFALPHTVNLAGGPVQYTYAALEFGEVPGLLFALNASRELLDGFTQEQKEQYLEEQLFKVVIIPGEMMGGKKAIPGVDFTNHDQVMKYFNLDDKKTKRVQRKK